MIFTVFLFGQTNKSLSSHYHSFLYKLSIWKISALNLGLHFQKARKNKSVFLSGWIAHVSYDKQLLIILFMKSPESYYSVFVYSSKVAKSLVLPLLDYRQVFQSAIFNPLASHINDLYIPYCSLCCDINISNYYFALSLWRALKSKSDKL